MRYIAALDYQHLDNGIFLNSLARSVSQQKKVHPIMLHGDSAYTERIMQTGVMRKEAQIRSIKDLNHRLIALFADQSISAIGINGYQQEFITLNDGLLKLDVSFFEKLSHKPVLLLSTLVWDEQKEEPVPVGLSKMAAFLQNELQAEHLFTFSSSEKDEIIKNEYPSQLSWNDLPDHFSKEYIPEEFHGFNKPLRLATARRFHQPGEENHSILIQ